MNAVLYTTQLEPITVIDLPMHAWDMLNERGRVNVAVQLPPIMEYGRIESQGVKMVSIYAERFRYRGTETLMLFTEDDENALLLHASFLAGQLSTQQKRERDAFVKGLVAAFRGLGEF